MPPTPTPKPVRLAIVGAGIRGAEAYGRWALEHPAEAVVVAVAEPDDRRRQRFAAQHALPPELTFSDWRELLTHDRLADALVVATPDRFHAEPTVCGLQLGYDILVEKPIAPTEAELEQVAQAAAAAGAGSVTVAHVLRHAPFVARIRGLLDQGRIGRLIAISHHENVSYWHFAHSFVRGNWRRADQASPMLLAKACHDLDLLRWFAGAPCTSVSSVGGLHHFTADNAPAGAPPRCTDGCPVADECPFYAPRFYVEQLYGVDGWPVSAITDDFSPEGRLRALREGPYGRCVYRSDNDVADHQSVLLEFANGVTATLTVSAFTADNTRTIKLMGTRGEIRGRLDTGEVELRVFHPAAVEQLGVGGGEGHSGGDEALMAAFCAHVRRRRAGETDSASLTSLEVSLESHRLAFAAERARLEGRVVRPAVSDQGF
ncbi:MAG TPA: Gfo/Idh/MocA family oxidoreductase [Candidatus Limnocylindria bacterium]|nr:Gfo/Idh/MocA family oxidoreductase [Candidatus Limnocylindria bacterium]